jgi:uncharacterized protein (DUF302 family)
MSYHLTTALTGKTHDEAIELVVEELQKEGFGVLTRIDVRDTLKKKIGADFRKYVILGACNPHFANQALRIEGKLGVLLPCNVVVEELEGGRVEVSIADPLAMMAGVHNPALEGVAAGVREKILRIDQGIKSRA